jgi:Mg2+-importing ATPase
MDEVRRARAQAVFDELSAQGFRLLGVAWRRVAAECNHAVVGDEAELVFAGYAGFLDPPKAGVAEVLKALVEHGVAIKIVSGDNELVTRHLCEQIGFPVTGVLTGGEMQNMDNPALAVRVEQANVFCRVTPAQKSRVIATLKSRNHVVGFLGDGINDAPALHMADTGISVDSAVDVAKAAADLILMEHDLGVLLDGVREGRRTFANVMKYIMMGTSSNFGNMFSMAAAAVVLPFLPMLPTQILLNNLLYDVSELALPFDRVDEVMLERPAMWDIGFVRRYMLCFGPVSSIFDFLTFFLLLKVFSANEALFHTGWFVESIATQVLVIFIIRTRGRPWASRADWRVVLLAAAAIIVAAALPYSPVASALGFVPLSPLLGAAICATVLAYLLATQGMKYLFYRYFYRVLHR